MSALVELSDSLWIAAEDVAEVSINPHNIDSFTVRMKNGIGHSVRPTYGKGIYATAEQLVAEINAARSAE